MKEKDEEKSNLNGIIEEYKKQLSKAEDDTDRVRWLAFNFDLIFHVSL